MAPADRSTTTARRRREGLRGRTRWLVIALALALIAAACGGDDGEAAGETENGDADDASGEPVEGGALTVAVGADFLSFDPLKMGGVPAGTVWPAIYDTLMAREEGEYVPHMAESLTPNDDLTSWTMELKPDITFHDGTPLDAEAVKFNVERHMDPANNSVVLTLAANIASVTVVDDLTVRFDLNGPWGQFPNVMVTQIGTMASPTAIQGQGEAYGQNPVGTGPYVFEEWVPGTSLTASKSDTYWSDEDAGYVDEIVFRVLTEPETALAALQSGQVDIMRTPIPSTIQEAEDAGMNVVRQADRALTTVLNSTKPPLDDPRVRQALAYATDNEAIVAAIQEGLAEPARPIPADHPFANDDIEWPGYDPDLARELLEDYGEPVSLRYGCDNTPDGTKLAELVQQMWEDVGVEVEPVLQEQASRINRTMVERDFDAECWAIPNQAWTDPDIQAYVWFISASPINISPVTEAAQQELDQAMQAGRTSADEAERAEAYHTYEEILAEEMPWIWHYSPAAAFLSGPRVQGVTEDNAATRDTPTVPVRDIWVED